MSEDRLAEIAAGIVDDDDEAPATGTESGHGHGVRRDLNEYETLVSAQGDDTVREAASEILDLMSDGIVDDVESEHGAGELGRADDEAKAEGWPSIEAKLAAVALADQLREEGVDDDAIEQAVEELRGDPPEPETEEGAPDDGAEDDGTDEDTQDLSDAERLAQEEHLDKVVTVRVNGEDVAVTLEEALAGYSRTAAWTQKSQALAEERRAFAADQSELQRGAEEVVQRLGYARQVLTAAGVSPQALNQLDGLYVQEAARQADFAAATKAQRIENARAQLPEVMGWSSEAEAKAAKAELMDFALEYGFSAEEVAAVDNPRNIKLLADAKAYRDMGTARAAVRQKASKARTLKPGQSKPKATAKKRSSKQKAVSRERLRQSGSAKDAASYLLDAGLLGDD